MTLQVLPEGTPLTGANAIAWAQAILVALGAPTSNLNIGYLLGWFNREGGGGQNNPMNTTLRTSGSEGSINSDGVQNYSTPAAGVSATVITLHNYPAIISSLRSGKGIPPGNPSIESELSRWSGGGYTSIIPLKVEIDMSKGIAKFKGSVNLATGEWNIQGVPSEGVIWEDTEKEFSAEVQLAVGGSKAGQWRIKGEPANAKPLGI